ncbi:hypothetical protein ONS95_000020 [Cadophora gregata]|uniref:uncharacterized protein n=1 Tax=Cadophora gregata TaxID=51156 RepID=UPI0026DAC7D6|nr:uncharacterized protein ONS95_000020 [Cadophora gregata]KAK0115720.1 hypothetical protein ONS96_014159 [Cadophora gregata f. sp. sojae]KAK0128034.1 hypothetical protein ONS95_000020 [Cadophora gregata]
MPSPTELHSFGNLYLSTKDHHPPVMTGHTNHPSTPWSLTNIPQAMNYLIQWTDKHLFNPASHHRNILDEILTRVLETLLPLTIAQRGVVLDKSLKGTMKERKKMCLTIYTSDHWEEFVEICPSDNGLTKEQRCDIINYLQILRVLEDVVTDVSRKHIEYQASVSDFNIKGSLHSLRHLLKYEAKLCILEDERHVSVMHSLIIRSDADHDNDDHKAEEYETVLEEEGFESNYYYEDESQDTFIQYTTKWLTRCVKTFWDMVWITHESVVDVAFT